MEGGDRGGGGGISEVGLESASKEKRQRDKEIEKGQKDREEKKRKSGGTKSPTPTPRLITALTSGAASQARQRLKESVDSTLPSLSSACDAEIGVREISDQCSPLLFSYYTRMLIHSHHHLNFHTDTHAHITLPPPVFSLSLFSLPLPPSPSLSLSLSLSFSLLALTSQMRDPGRDA